MCLFCKIIQGDIPSSKVYEDEDILAILDISQQTKGHTLVMPKKHYDNIYDCDPEVLEKLIVVVKKLVIQLTEKLQAEGCNILVNNNEAAGQVIKHLHFHIIPRYTNDEFTIEGKDHQYDLAALAKEITE